MSTTTTEDAEGSEISDISPSISTLKKRVFYGILFICMVTVLFLFLGKLLLSTIIVALLAVLIPIYIYSLTTAEKRWFNQYQKKTRKDISETVTPVLQNLVDEYKEGYQKSLDRAEEAKENSVRVCRECRQEVSSNVKRCPHCGWKPKKRGGLWWGTTAVTSLTPIGWAMAAKGAKDNHKASKGVWEETTIPEKSNSSEEDRSDSDPIEKLERLAELRESGVIDENEFAEKKQELLDQV